MVIRIVSAKVGKKKKITDDELQRTEDCGEP